MAETKTTAKTTAELQHSIIGVGAAEGGQSGHTEHPDAQWFGEAGLGMFLHWGLSCVSGDVDLSWGMYKNTPFDQRLAGVNKLMPSEYFKLAERFQPDQYDPDKWCAAAKEAGMRYVVLTTRHHEGYALWPSEYGDFSTRTHMGGRDLLAPYVAACRKYGLKVGFYYSPPDWHYFRDYMSFGYRDWDDTWNHTPVAEHLRRIGLYPEPCGDVDVNWQPTTVKKPPEALVESYKLYIRGQITELLTRYGQIDVLWFDGRAEHCDVPPMSIEEIRALQPGIVIDPRMHGKADFDTSECAFPKSRFPSWWEGCYVVGHDWGYTADECYKPLSQMLSLIAKHRAWHGNLLMNFGPDAHGRLPETAYERLRGIGKWLEKHSEAVFDVDGGRWPETCNVPETRRGKVSYLFMADGELIADIKTDDEIESACILETGDPVDHVHTDKGYQVFRLKPHQETDKLPVVKVLWK